MKVEIELTQDAFDALVNEVTKHVLLSIAADQKVESPPAWMSIPAAANYMGVTEGRMRKLIARREIVFHQEDKGCRILLARGDLDRHMEKRRTDLESPS